MEQEWNFSYDFYFFFIVDFILFKRGFMDVCVDILV